MNEQMNKAFIIKIEDVEIKTQLVKLISQGATDYYYVCTFFRWLANYLTTTTIIIYSIQIIS